MMECLSNPMNRAPRPSQCQRGLRPTRNVNSVKESRSPGFPTEIRCETLVSRVGGFDRRTSWTDDESKRTLHRQCRTNRCNLNEVKTIRNENCNSAGRNCGLLRNESSLRKHLVFLAVVGTSRLGGFNSDIMRHSLILDGAKDFGTLANPR